MRQRIVVANTVLTNAQWVLRLPITHTLHLLTLLAGPRQHTPHNACHVIKGGSGALFMQIFRLVIKIEINSANLSEGRGILNVNSEVNAVCVVG